MKPKKLLWSGVAVLAISLLGLIAGLRWDAPARVSAEALARLYGEPVTRRDGPMRVYHLGHSLVGRDMPAMLQQLAGEGHHHESQLAWGATLKGHWGDAPLNGFDAENDHDRYRPAGEALDSGDYDAVVVTEMVEIRDAIKYFDSSDYLARWAKRAWQANKSAQLYLYETWHRTDDPEGWLERLDKDSARYWENEVLYPALAATGAERPIHVIPAGQVMARFVRAVEGRGGVGGISGRQDLFARQENGERDAIHVNDLGAYLVALTHYAVLYQRSPIGLPFRLQRADGSAAEAPDAELAKLMQETVWSVVTENMKTGVRRQVASGALPHG